MKTRLSQGLEPNDSQPKPDRENKTVFTLKTRRLTALFAAGMLALASSAHADQQSLKSACAAINPAGAKLMSALKVASEDPSVDPNGLAKVYQRATADFKAETKSVVDPVAKSRVDALSLDLQSMTNASAELAAAAEAGKSDETIHAIMVTKYHPGAQSFDRDWDVLMNTLCSGYDH